MKQTAVDTNLPIADRFAFLRACNDDYESGESPITDAEYDNEFYELQSIDPTNELFASVGGIDDNVYGTKVRHAHMMGSLLKSRNPDEFLEWLIKTFGSQTINGILQYKLDGLALTCHYNKGKLQQVLTRGDGTYGFDVTNNARMIEGIPDHIEEKCYVEVRGECYKDRQDFINNWLGEYANPRNFATGAVFQKDPAVTKERKVSFIAYEAVHVDFKTEDKKIEFLSTNGFNTLEADTMYVNGTTDEISQYCIEFMERINRPNLPFDIDGIVFKLNDIAQQKAMGTVDEGRRPKANRAIKFPTEQKETKLIGIEWSIGRTGQLTPVGLLEPVKLGGATVQRSSLHNLKELTTRLGITKIDTTILLEKAGDIIPKVIRKISDGTGPDIVIPDICPACRSDLEWDSTHTTKWCRSVNCSAQICSGLDHWFKVIGVKGIGAGIISRLTGMGLVNSIIDMYHLRTYDKSIKGEFGNRAGEKILDAIDSVREMPLEKFIKALGIGQVGRLAREIVAVAPTIEDIDKLTIADLSRLPQFGSKKAVSFKAGWKSLRPMISQLAKEITFKIDKPQGSKLLGQSYCFTGSFSNPSRKDMEAIVVANGGKCSSVSKNLTALVWDGEISGGKVAKAKSLGIEMISQSDFLRRV